MLRVRVFPQCSCCILSFGPSLCTSESVFVHALTPPQHYTAVPGDSVSLSLDSWLVVRAGSFLLSWSSLSLGQVLSVPWFDIWAFSVILPLLPVAPNSAMYFSLFPCLREFPVLLPWGQKTSNHLNPRWFPAPPQKYRFSSCTLSPVTMGSLGWQDLPFP